MKHLIYACLAVVLLGSCNSTTNQVEEHKEEPNIDVHAELSQDSKVFLGNRLFSEKTCITCHDVNQKKIGPSIVDIMTIYKAEKASIFNFLKGNAVPIVDTTAEEVAIMQANIDGFLKNITDVELDAIQTYMMHVDELKLR